MSPDTLSSPKERGESLSGPSCRKPSSVSQEHSHIQQTLNCPRCNSSNTKFCYYNNYSLSQPRHFCKTCRRYWTKGGALRNVPVGGGSRKTNKKALKSSSSTSPGDYASIGGLRTFFDHGLVSRPAAFDFHLGGLTLNRLENPPPAPPAPPLFQNNNNSSNDYNNIQLSSNSCFNLDHHRGFSSYPLIQETNINNTGSITDVNTTNLITSSIESLSNLNQDLHLKLQQQRMAMIFGQVNESMSEPAVINPFEKPQPILFRNLDMDCSRQKESAMTEWFFGNSSATNNNYDPNSVITTPVAMSGEGGSGVVSERANHDHWNGVQAWCDFQHQCD